MVPRPNRRVVAVDSPVVRPTLTEVDMPLTKRAAHIGTYNNEVPLSQQISFSAWRTRLRRLTYAIRCAEDGDCGAWIEAQRIAAGLVSKDLGRLQNLWRSERSSKAPKLGDGSAAALWWEYLATGGLPRLA